MIKQGAQDNPIADNIGTRRSNANHLISDDHSLFALNVSVDDFPKILPLKYDVSSFAHIILLCGVFDFGYYN